MCIVKAGSIIHNQSRQSKYFLFSPDTQLLVAKQKPKSTRNKRINPTPMFKFNTTNTQRSRNSRLL